MAWEDGAFGEALIVWNAPSLPLSHCPSVGKRGVVSHSPRIALPAVLSLTVRLVSIWTMLWRHHSWIFCRIILLIRRALLSIPKSNAQSLSEPLIVNTICRMAEMMHGVNNFNPTSLTPPHNHKSKMTFVGRIRYWDMIGFELTTL